MIKNTSPEILVLIFKNLPKKNLRNSISLVCKHWHKLVYDFHLIQSNVVLQSNFGSSCIRLMEDFKKYPTFAPGIKSIDIEEEVVVDAFRFTQLIQSCPNVEELYLYASKRSNILMCILPQLFSPQTPLQTKLKILDIDYIDLGKYRERMDERKRISFVKNGPDGNTNRSLESIVIESPYSIMTKDCLEYLISGNFTQLETLNLFMRLSEDQGGKINVEEMKKDAIWNRLEQFCSSSLKSYNICFRAYNGMNLFSIDNCTGKFEAYGKESPFVFFRPYHDPSDSEGDSDDTGCALDRFLDAVGTYEENFYYPESCAYD